ncbi:MAG: hypothetical protein U9N77_13015 [Thermodesulfobacteriota bacterium]|nr:hypothetical protein [Thermodesulfobacteriota bacterium]
MGRRRRQGISTSLAAGDPGKDLFAYLFLLIMVFSFMLLMSFEQAGSARKAPESEKSGTSTLATISKDNIATLEEINSKIFLRFGKDLYDPENDLEKFEQDKKNVVVKQDGREEQRFLYIEKKNQEDISLFEYLETFKRLSQKNISIAFTREVL